MKKLQAKSEEGRYAVPKGKKSVLVDHRTWVIVDASRPDEEVITKFQALIDRQKPVPANKGYRQKNSV